MNYEVKIRLADALEGNELKQELVDAFNIEGPEDIGMQFLDGPDRELFRVGYVVRFRMFGGQIVMTIKRRFPIRSTENDAVDDAAEAGIFDDLEVEVNRNSQTLTYSADLTVEGDDLPGLKESCGHFLSNFRDMVPSELAANIEEQIPQQWHLFGPATGKRWDGSRNGVDKEITFESWRLPEKDGHGFEHVVECSFKKKNEDKLPEKAQERLIESLGDFASEFDSLKTPLFYERFAIRAAVNP